MTARIYETGYRRYDGPRLEVRHAVVRLAIDGLRHVLGIRRRFRSKLLPWGFVAAASLPAIILVGVRLLIPPEIDEVAQEILPPVGDYMFGVILVLYLAAAVAGPAALCPDRRSGALALYLASPLDRDTYLLGRAGSVLSYLLMVTMIPTVVLVTGTILAGRGPDGPLAVLAEYSRITVTGVVLALLLGALSMAAASVTDRQTLASAIVVLYLMGSGVIFALVVFGLDAPRVLLLLDLASVGREFGLVVFGGDTDSNVAPVVQVATTLGWIGALGAFTRWRYRHVAVSR